MNISTKIAKTYSKACTLAIIALFASSVLSAQVAVAPLQLVRQQFLSATGVPLSGGCLQFFATGTSTPQAIYADSTGTSQLSNPLTLDAAGEASVWMTNTGYDIVANTGVNNTACSVALGTQLWRENNKNPFSIINGGSNYIVASGTVDPSGSFGMLAARSDIPCLRFFTTIWDCVVELTLNQTLTNKSATLDANTINCASNIAGQYARNNGTKLVCAAIPESDITISFPNNVSGTLLNSLAKFAGATGTVIFTSAGDTTGMIGIVIAGNGVLGNATIQTKGLVNCAFDGATTNGDYVQISATQTGGCHDSGVAPPNYPTSGGDVVGRVLSTNAGLGTYQLYLFGPENRSIPSTVSVSTLNKQDTQGSATTGTGSAQVVYTYTMPGASLGVGKCLDITFYLQKVSGTNSLTPSITFGATTIITGPSTASNTSWEMTAKVCNNAGTTTAQWSGSHGVAGLVSFLGSTASPAENTAGSVVITGTANVAAPDTWKGFGWTVVTEP